MRRIRPAGLLLAVLALAGPLAARAQPAPRCSASLDGQTRCESASLCICAFDSGGTVAGRVAAWRWTCDMMKMCGDPAPAGAAPQPPPPGYGGWPQFQPPPPVWRQTSPRPPG